MLFLDALVNFMVKRMEGESFDCIDHILAKTELSNIKILKSQINNHPVKYHQRETSSTAISYVQYKESYYKL